MPRLLGLMLVLALMIAAGHLLEWRRSPEGKKVWDKLALPYRLARLQASPAERTLAMPVQGVPARKIADTWKAARSGGRRHEGQDIFARRGTPVIAAADGVVTRIAHRGIGGKFVFVFGSGGRAYYYAHLDDWAPGLYVGRPVRTGDTLGFVGNTGNARTSAPHLHFGVYGAGGAMNPLPLLQQPKSDAGA